MKIKNLFIQSLWTLFFMGCISTQTVRADLVLQNLCRFPAINAPSTNASPQLPGALVEANDGSFYGCASGGSNYVGFASAGSFSGNGTIFRATKGGVMTPIFSFNGTNGNGPSGGLIWGNDGYLYGVTRNGGTNYSGANDYIFGSDGTIFKITTNGSLTSLFQFRGTNGTWPTSRLALGPDGNFYGTTFYGGNGFTSGQSGNGTVFEYSTNGNFTEIFAFSGTNGCNLVAGLTPGPDGNLYGVTEFGGINYSAGGGNTGNGTLFRISTNGNFTTLAFFNGTNGSVPLSALTLGPDNNFYGTTRCGGIGYVAGSIFSGDGTVFQLTTNGDLTTILAFNGTNGGNPSGGLTLGGDGCLYGSTPWIGSNDSSHFGTLFRITTNGTLTTLVALNGTNAIHSHADMILGEDGNLYGAMIDVQDRAMPDGSLGGVFRLVAPPAVECIKQGIAATVSWSAFTNAVYNVEFNDSLSQSNWTVLATNIPAISNSASITDDQTSTQRFYRVRLLP